MRRLIPVTLLAGLALFGLATPALAHNTLVDSNPKDGASLDAGPTQIVLTYDEPVQEGDQVNTIVVLGPQQDHWENCGVKVQDNTVSVPVRPLGPAGEYSISWRILSADGHPVSGQFKFTLTKAGTGSPTPADELAKCSPTAAATQQTAAGDSGGIPAWVWIVGAGVLLCLGVVLALRMGGRDEGDQG